MGAAAGYEYSKYQKTHLRGPGGKGNRLLHLLVVMLVLGNVGLIYYMRHAHGACVALPTLGWDIDR